MQSCSNFQQTALMKHIIKNSDLTHQAYCDFRCTVLRTTAFSFASFSAASLRRCTVYQWVAWGTKGGCMFIFLKALNILISRRAHPTQESQQSSSVNTYIIPFFKAFYSGHLMASWLLQGTTVDSKAIQGQQWGFSQQLTGNNIIKPFTKPGLFIRN